MQLPKLTLIPPKIQSGALFPALELVMDSKAFSQAIAETKSQEKRKRGNRSFPLQKSKGNLEHGDRHVY